LHHCIFGLALVSSHRQTCFFVRQSGLSRIMYAASLSKSDQFYVFDEQAKTDATIEHRCIAGQLEFSARVGRAALDKPDLPSNTGKFTAKPPQTSIRLSTMSRATRSVNG